MVLGTLHACIHVHTFANTPVQQQKQDPIHS